MRDNSPGPVPIPPFIRGVRWPDTVEERTEALAETILEAWRSNWARRFRQQPRPPRNGARIPHRLTWNQVAPRTLMWMARPYGAGPTVIRRVRGGWAVVRIGMFVRGDREEPRGVFPNRRMAALSVTPDGMFRFCPFGR